MEIWKVKEFNLGVKDFDSGKIFPPQKEDWIKCDCCGRLMYKGFELNNGDRVGKECETSIYMFRAHKIKNQKEADFMGITKKQFNYLLEQNRK